ncbi:MAG: hypothetical protein WC217_00110 [Candidatus Paceibacterota bacterium]|jgi:hypothetical protein
MATLSAEEVAIRASFDWIYGHANDIRRDMGKRADGQGQTVFVIILAIHWSMQNLSKLITDYWANNAHNESKIRECIEHVFREVDSLKGFGYMFMESEKVEHKQRLLNIIEERTVLAE